MRNEKRTARHSGFTMLEAMIATVITLLSLSAIFGTQTQATKAFSFHETGAQLEQDLARAMSRLDSEFRRATSSSLEVEGIPFPTAPTDGTNYTAMTFRQVVYDTAAQQTIQDATAYAIALNGTDLQFTSAAGTMTICRDVSAFNVVWNSVLRQLTFTVQITKTFPDNTTLTRAKTQSVHLRNV